MEHKTCVFIFSESYLILKILRDIINKHRSSCKVPNILVRFEWKLNFLNRFFKIPRVSNLMKIRPTGAELFLVDG
jgi:hypothetical protein